MEWYLESSAEEGVQRTGRDRKKRKRRPYAASHGGLSHRQPAHLGPAIYNPPLPTTSSNSLSFSSPMLCAASELGIATPTTAVHSHHNSRSNSGNKLTEPLGANLDPQGGPYYRGSLQGMHNSTDMPRGWCWW
jgi:hypothetical protein